MKRRKTKPTPKTILCHKCDKRFITQKSSGKWIRRKQKCPFCGFEGTKPMSKSQMIRRADMLFSRLARFTRSENGIVRCCTCGKKKHWRSVDAGHYMSRRFYATRWDLDNVWPQCRPDNSGFGANHWKPNESVRERYEQFLRLTVGPDAPERLHAKATAEFKLKTSELVALIEVLETACKRYELI